MTATTCKWDGDVGEYLTPDGEICDTPRREHCTARKTCPVHLGWGELTCARCVGRTRQDIRTILQLAALMLPEAMASGVNSRAAIYAGPSGDPLYLSWRRVNEVRGTHDLIGDGAEETDPTAVLGIWQAMLSEDYGHELPDRITLSGAAAYLERNLHTVAQDEEQDWRLMASEIRKCRSTLESVIHNSHSPERGEPCPDCKLEGHVVRMARRYSHWCEDPKCERIHVDTDEYDEWICKRNSAHNRDMESYEKYAADRRKASA